MAKKNEKRKEFTPEELAVIMHKSDEEKAYDKAVEEYIGPEVMKKAKEAAEQLLKDCGNDSGLAGLAIMRGIRKRLLEIKAPEEPVHLSEYNISLARIDQQIKELDAERAEKRELQKQLAKSQKDLEAANKKLTKDGKVKIALSLMTQRFETPKQLSVFAEKEANLFSMKHKLPAWDTSNPVIFGYSHNKNQSKVVDGLLKELSLTGYKGTELIDKKNHATITTNTPAYKNIIGLPMIRLTQSELLTLCGYSTSKGDKQDAIQALEDVTTDRVYSCWSRLVLNGKGKPSIDPKTKKYVKEIMLTRAPLFTLDRAYTEKGVFKYYEITASAVVIDQTGPETGGNHWILYPDGWKEDIERIVGKSPSNYFYVFIDWLRIKFETIRAHNAKASNKTKKSYQITTSWDDLAREIKMPESMVKGQRKITREKIYGFYEVAVKAGYLLSIEKETSESPNDILFFNKKAYHRPESEEKKEAIIKI